MQIENRKKTNLEKNEQLLTVADGLRSWLSNTSRKNVKCGMFIKFSSLNKNESFSTSSILSKITILIVVIESRTELDRLHFLVKLKIRAEKRDIAPQ